MLIRCLLGRRCAVLTDRTDARALAAQIERHRVTVLSLVPALLQRLLDLDPPWNPSPRLRAVLLGGAHAPQPMPRALAARSMGWGA